MKKRKNDKLTNARVNRNDEYYTQLKDVESELQHYKEHFADQWIYLPCDTEDSNFWRYFKNNYDELKLGHLTATHINHTGNSYRLDFDGVIGVPATYLDKHCPEQFEIVAVASGNSWRNYTEDLKALGFKTDKYGGGLGTPAVGGKAVFFRIMIKRKNEKLLYI